MRGRPKTDILSRFKEKIRVRDDGCWEWTGTVNRDYGQFWDGEKLVYAHRYSYELYIGRIPDDKQLDHLCRNKLCVNPSHLEPVAAVENVHRGLNGVLGQHHNLVKTHCPHGHTYTSENTYLFRETRGGIGRQCRICVAARDATK